MAAPQNSPRLPGSQAPSPRSNNSPRWPALEQASRERSSSDGHPGVQLRDVSRQYERMLANNALRYLTNAELSELHSAHLRMLQVLQDAEWQRCQKAEADT